MTKPRDLEPIGNDVDALLVRLGMPASLNVMELIDDWEKVAGEAFAGRSQPVGLKDGELVIEVENGAIASLLRYRVGPLLDSLREHFGEGAIDSIRIRVENRKK